MDQQFSITLTTDRAVIDHINRALDLEVERAQARLNEDQAVMREWRRFQQTYRVNWNDEWQAQYDDDARRLAEASDRLDLARRAHGAFLQALDQAIEELQADQELADFFTQE